MVFSCCAFELFEDDWLELWFDCDEWLSLLSLLWWLLLVESSDTLELPLSLSLFPNPQPANTIDAVSNVPANFFIKESPLFIFCIYITL